MIDRLSKVPSIKETDCCQLMGRKYIGIELKESYYNVALKNLQTAEGTSSIEQESLFDI